MKPYLQIKRIHILLALLTLSVCVIPFRDKLIRPVATLIRLSKGTHNVKGRLAQYGGIVRERLADDFKRLDCPYPPAKLLLVGLKKEKKLEVWVKSEETKGYALLKVYPIQGLCGGLGPKLAEGDGQVPEGIYRIDWLNPNSRYHLSMHIDYPNEYDKAKAAEDGRVDLGGEIMIHGGHASAGCLAMGDEAAEDLFVLVAETGLSNVEVILSPVDFRVRELPKEVNPLWTDELYRIIKGRLLKEIRLWPFGLGHADSDGDGLSNASEGEIGTDISVKDTYGLSRYVPEYSIYASYADEDLFCRWKQGEAPKGNESKDWSSFGAQFPKRTGD